MKKALCIGINRYPGLDADLSGCINDSNDWASYIHKKVSSDYKISVMHDAHATKKNMVVGMRDVVQSLQVGETGIITFSGHGTWMPDMNGDERDGRDEALCPCDVSETNVLLDDEMHRIFRALVPGARLVFITDSCHSGTVHRMINFSRIKRKPRYMPPAQFIKDLTILGRAAQRPAVHVRPTNAPLPGVIHFGGCGDKEYSYDAEFGGRPNGAMTYRMLEALAAAPAGMTYANLYVAVRKFLPSDDYPQSPSLNALADDQNRPVFQ